MDVPQRVPYTTHINQNETANKKERNGTAILRCSYLYLCDALAARALTFCPGGMRSASVGDNLCGRIGE
jgi:hypothetical protein